MSDKLQAEREWTQAELCELLPPDVMWQDNLTPELLRYVLSRASLSSSQQVREEALTIPTAEEYLAQSYGAASKDWQNGYWACRNYVLDRLKSSPASPSQPSSVAMTDNHPAWTRPVLYTDTLDGKQTCRDDLWAITTEELHVLLQSSPKGASTGMEPARQIEFYARQILTLQRELVSGEAWKRGLVDDTIELAERILASLSSPQEASKPQDGAAQNGQNSPETRTNATSAPLLAASQPSAASGRELPPDDECIVHIYPSDLARMAKDETTATVFSVAVGCPDEKSVPLYTAEQMRAALTGAAPADANVGGQWTVFHNGKSVTAETWSQCIVAARQLRTPEEEAIAASKLAAAIAAEAAEDEAERATMLTAIMPRITAEEMAAFSRFCECCEDFDSGGYDVDKDMMKRLACIGLVRAYGFGRYETTLFGDEVRSDSTATPTPTAPEPSAPADKVDTERFEWYFGQTDKTEFIPEYLTGMEEKWSIDQWRVAIDAAIDRMRSESGKGGKL